MAQKNLTYIKGKDSAVDLRKNWVQFNDHNFEALNFLTLKAGKTVIEDPVSYALLKALETSEILLVSEYSYEMSFNQKYKQQDYDLFHLLVGAPEHAESVINLHRVFLSLVLDLQDELRSQATGDERFTSKLDSLFAKVDKAVNRNDLLPSLELSEPFYKSYKYETLNEAQQKKCTYCYFHSLLNEKAVTPAALF